MNRHRCNSIQCPRCFPHLAPATPPADDANRAPVSGGLDEGEREALSVGYYDAATETDALALVERILATRDAAWVERLAAVEGEREALAWAEMLAHQECAAKKHPDWFIDSEHSILCPWCRAEAAEAERDTARREAGERIAQAIEAHPSPHLTRIYAARIARADALTSDDGSEA